MLNGNDNYLDQLPVVVIGAGPVGLAAAAHLLERGLRPVVFEAGETVGANVLDWAHVRMFSPWEFTVDSATVRMLEASGWEMPPAKELPTGGDLVTQYMRPFAALPQVKPHIHLKTRVTAISRRNIDLMKDAGRDKAPFVVQFEQDGDEDSIEAQAVIDASGTWHSPNPLGANGLRAKGEAQNADRIHYGIPDVTGKARSRYAGKRVMVVGSGHSAINALLELAELRQEADATQVYWAMRGRNLQRVYGGGTDDALPARGRLGQRIKAHVDAGTVHIVAPFRVTELTATDGGVQVIGQTDDGVQTITVDEIVASTGARPELDMLRELRLDIDPALESARTLAPMIDPNIHSCGTVRPHGEAELRHPEPNFYIAGMKSYGRAPTFLLATGYEQVRSIVAALAGDWEAAQDVQLCLPETGVCSTDFADEGAEGAACCAPVTSQGGSVALGEIQVK